MKTGSVTPALPLFVSTALARGCQLPLPQHTDKLLRRIFQMDESQGLWSLTVRLLEFEVKWACRGR